MNALMTQQDFGTFLRLDPEFSRHAHRCHLNEHAPANVGLDEFGTNLKLRVPFGMYKNGMQALELQLVKEVSSTNRNHHGWKFHQHVIPVVKPAEAMIPGMIDNLV